MRAAGLFIRKHWVIISIIAVVLLVSMMMVRSEPKKNNILLAGVPSEKFPLTEGSKGVEVENLQKYLNTKGETLAVDGIFGPLTREAVSRVFGRMLIGQTEYNEIILKSI